MKYLFALPLLFAASIPALVAEEKQDQVEASSAKAELKMLPESGIPATWIQGTPVKGWEKDKLYIFEFWATWCGPCLAAIPHLEAIHEKVTKEKLPVQIIGVNVFDRATPEKLKDFIKSRPTPPTYTIAFDSAKQSEAQWLKPLDVNGIPFALAVKNGEILWKGHPSQLSTDFVREMSAVGFVAGKASPSSPQSETTAARERADAIKKLFSKGEHEKAELELQKYIDDATMPKPQKLSLLETPVYRALYKNDFRKMNAALRRKAETFPEDFGNQRSVANFVLNADDVPVKDRDLALAIECLNRADALSQDGAGALARRNLVQSMLADVYAARGDLDLEKKARQIAWESTRDYARLNKIVEKLKAPDADPKLLKLYEEIDSGKKSIPAGFIPTKKESAKTLVVDQRTPADFTPSTSEEAKEMLAFFKSLRWVQGECPETLPADGLVLVDFWFPPRPGPASSLMDRKPALWIDQHLNGKKNAQVLVLAIEEIPGRPEVALTFPKFSTPYPVGVLEKNTITTDFLKKFNISRFPAAFALRDGKMIWSGTAQNLPMWLVDEAVKPDFDFEAFKAEQQKEKEELGSVYKKIAEARSFGAKKDFEKMKKALEALKPELEKNVSLDMMATEILLSERAMNDDFAGAGKIAKELMEKHPESLYVAERLMKVLTSNEDLRKENRPVLIQACRNILAAGTPHVSAYWGIISSIYGEMGDAENSLYAALAARDASVNYQQWKELSAKK